MTKRTERKDKKALLALLLLLVAIAIIIGTALAFFSDTGLVTFAGKAGTLEIEVNGGTEELTGTQYFTKAGVATAETFNTENMNPGDYIYLPFTVKNDGTKSAWVKSELGDVLVDGVKDTSGMFTLLAIPDTVTAGTEDAWIKAEIVKAKASRGFVSTSDIDTILKGSEEADSAIDTATLRYVLYFDEDAGNSLQGVSVDFDINVTAVQYRNNGSSSLTADWTLTP